jgi:hypothetical protein
MVISAFGTGFRVTTGPDTRIHPILLDCQNKGVLSEEGGKEREVHRPLIEGIVDTSPLPLKRRSQAQMRRRLNNGLG